nr:achaete-scute homolog 5 [Manis javanica]
MSPGSGAAPATWLVLVVRAEPTPRRDGSGGSTGPMSCIFCLALVDRRPRAGCPDPPPGQAAPAEPLGNAPLLLYPGRAEPPFPGAFGVPDYPFEPALTQQRKERERRRVNRPRPPRRPSSRRNPAPDRARGRPGGPRGRPSAGCSRGAAGSAAARCGAPSRRHPPSVPQCHRRPRAFQLGAGGRQGIRGPRRDREPRSGSARAAPPPGRRRAAWDGHSGSSSGHAPAVHEMAADTSILLGSLGATAAAPPGEEPGGTAGLR